MKAFAAAIGAVALLGGFQSFRHEDGEMAAAVGQAKAPGAYSLIANGGAMTCIVKRGPALADGLSELVVGPKCPALLPGIERARFWRDRKDGTIGFSENGVSPLVSFEAGDGVDYESYAPALPLLALVAQ